MNREEALKTLQNMVNDNLGCSCDHDKMCKECGIHYATMKETLALQFAIDYIEMRY